MNDTESSDTSSLTSAAQETPGPELTSTASPEPNLVQPNQESLSSNEQKSDSPSTTNETSSTTLNSTLSEPEDSLSNKKQQEEKTSTSSSATQPSEIHDDSIENAAKTNDDTSTTLAENPLETPPNSTSSQKQIQEPQKQQQPPQKTSLYANKQPKPQQARSGGQWSSLLKRAIATVESTIDNVIEESSTTGVGSSSTPASAPSKPAEPVAPVPVSAPETKPALSTGRLSMQERLAMAVKKSAGATPTRSSTSSPLQHSDNASPIQSMDSARSSIEAPIESLQKTVLKQADENPDNTIDKESNTVEKPQASKPEIFVSAASTPPAMISRIASPIQRELDNNNTSFSSNYPILNTIFKHIETLGINDELVPEVEEIKKDFKKFVKQLSSQEEAVQEELSSYIEKASSLESKLIFVSHEEAERAKESRLSSSGIAKQLAAKEEQVALLIEEGQLMSKKELKHMNTIKMLRAKAKDQEQLAVEARDRQSRAEKEADKLKEKIKTFTEIEKRQSADIKSKSKLGAEVEALRKTKSDNEATIESLTEEISLLKAKNSEEVVAVQTKALEAEKEHASALQSELSKVQLELTVFKEKHTLETAELEARMVKDAIAWETTKSKMEKDIRSLEARVEMFRSRSEELSSGTSSDSNVTLLRQIEVLQSQHNIATENWNGIEQNLQNRITSLEQQLEESGTREAYFRKKVKTLVSEFILF